MRIKIPKYDIDIEIEGIQPPSISYKECVFEAAGSKKRSYTREELDEYNKKTVDYTAKVTGLDKSTIEYVLMTASEFQQGEPL